MHDLAGDTDLALTGSVSNLIVPIGCGGGGTAVGVGGGSARGAGLTGASLSCVSTTAAVTRPPATTTAPST